jgi:hypothetical protein
MESGQYPLFPGPPQRRHSLDAKTPPAHRATGAVAWIPALSGTRSVTEKRQVLRTQGLQTRRSLEVEGADPVDGALLGHLRSRSIMLGQLRWADNGSKFRVSRGNATERAPRES